MRNTNKFRRCGSELAISVLTALTCLAFARVSSGQQNLPTLQIGMPVAESGSSTLGLAKPSPPGHSSTVIKLLNTSITSTTFVFLNP